MRTSRPLKKPSTGSLQVSRRYGKHVGRQDRIVQGELGRPRLENRNPTQTASKRHSVHRARRHHTGNVPHRFNHCFLFLDRHVAARFHQASGPSRPASRPAAGSPAERAACAPCRAPRQARPLPAACRWQFVRPATGPAGQTGAAALNPPARSSSPATDCSATPGAPELIPKNNALIRVKIRATK